MAFINKAETKEEIINLIYNLRYYIFLPFNEKNDLADVKDLKKELYEVIESLLKKAIDFKIITAISEDEAENIELLQYIFKTRITSIEGIYISIKKENDIYSIEFSDNNENSYEEKFEVNNIKKEMLNIKLNKQIKVFL